MPAGVNIELSKDHRSIFLQEELYIFRTILGSVGLMEGIHYWEIVADARTEHEVKIGVSGNPDAHKDDAFSDYEYGWAFFGSSTGELRHNSNASGEQYGKHFKRQGILGVFLNMNKGKLSFAIDGINYGTAFEDEKLKKGPLFPAIALLHNSGCTLVTGLKPPPYFFE